MAKQSGIGDKFYVGGRDLSGNVTSVDTLMARRAVLDTPTIDSSGMVRLQGQADGEIAVTSWFDDGTNLEHAAFSALPTGDIVVLYCRGSAADSPAAGLVAKQINYDGAKSQDKALAMNVQCLGQGTSLEWGVLLQAEATHSSATSSSSKDDSSSSSNGIAAYLQLLDINSGAPTIKLQHSANNSSWSDLITFTAVSDGSEPAAERKEASGTVNRYLRATSTGTFSNAKFVIMYRRGESVDVTAY
jgi:hypothetical protein